MLSDVHSLAYYLLFYLVFPLLHLFQKKKKAAESDSAAEDNQPLDSASQMVLSDDDDGMPIAKPLSEALPNLPPMTTALMSTPSTGTAPTYSLASSRRGKASSKKSTASKDHTEAVLTTLCDSRHSSTHMKDTLTDILRLPDSLEGEKLSWGTWLSYCAQQVPNNMWVPFLCDSFHLVKNYLPLRHISQQQSSASVPLHQSPQQPPSGTSVQPPSGIGLQPPSSSYAPQQPSAAQSVGQSFIPSTSSYNTGAMSYGRGYSTQQPQGQTSGPLQFDLSGQSYGQSGYSQWGSQASYAQSAPTQQTQQTQQTQATQGSSGQSDLQQVGLDTSPFVAFNSGFTTPSPSPAPNSDLTMLP